jgi:hypothetical protein
MRFDYRKWSDIQKKVHSISATLSQMDGYNKTSYSQREILDEALLYEAAKEAHESRNTYFVTFYEGEKPYCLLTSVRDFRRVQFFDEFSREYLSYDFRSPEDYSDKLFLETALYREYEKDKDKQISATNFIFKIDGNLSMIEYDTIKRTQNNLIDIKTIDVSSNWEEYPKFGQYESIIRKERGLEM